MKNFGRFGFSNERTPSKGFALTISEKFRISKTFSDVTFHFNFPGTTGIFGRMESVQEQCHLEVSRSRTSTVSFINFCSVDVLHTNRAGSSLPSDWTQYDCSVTLTIVRYFVLYLFSLLKFPMSPHVLNFNVPIPVSIRYSVSCALLPFFVIKFL